MLGTWRVVERHQQNGKVEDDRLQLYWFRGGDVWVDDTLNDSKWDIYKVTLDTTKSPKQIDLLSSNSARKKLGIYQIDKDKLTICFSAGTEGKRPMGFSATDKHTQLLTLKREDDNELTRRLSR